MSLEPAGKTFLINSQKWPRNYIYMMKIAHPIVSCWKGDPGPQGHWTLEKIGSNLYKVAPKQWPNWYMCMLDDHTVCGWWDEPDDQERVHWYVEQRGTVIVDGKFIPTYTFRNRAFPYWYMYLENGWKKSVRGWRGDPDIQGYFILSEIKANNMNLP